MLIHATFPRKIHAHYRPTDRVFRLSDDAGNVIKDLYVDDVRICVEQQEPLPIAVKGYAPFELPLNTLDLLLSCVECETPNGQLIELHGRRVYINGALVATLPGPASNIRVHPVRGGGVSRERWRFAMIVGPDCGYMLDTETRTVVALDTGEPILAEDTVQRAAGGAA